MSNTKAEKSPDNAENPVNSNPGYTVRKENLVMKYAGAITFETQRRESDYKYRVVVLPGSLVIRQWYIPDVLVECASDWVEDAQEALALALYRYLAAVA